MRWCSNDINACCVCALELVKRWLLHWLKKWFRLKWPRRENREMFCSGGLLQLAVHPSVCVIHYGLR